MKLFGLPVGGLLDRWILRSFVLAYVVAATSLLVLFVVFDMSAKVEGLAADDGSGGTVRLAQLTWYYLLVLPDLLVALNHAVVRPPTPLYAQLSDVVQRELNGLFTAAGSADEAMATSQQRSQTLLRAAGATP